MPSLNKVQLIGVVGDKPQKQTSTNGVVYSIFTLCTKSAFKSKTTGETVESAEWHNLISWGSQAEALYKYVDKGALIYVEGRLSTRIWEHDPEKRHKTLITTDNILFIDITHGVHHTDDVVELPK